MRTTRKAAIAFAVAFLFLATACGRSANSTTSAAPSGSDLLDLPTTTTAGTQPVDKIVWGLYRETATLDPIFAFDYPDNTPLALMCETLLKQAPDGSIGDGIASLETPDDTTLVFTLKDGVTFWDGNPVTPDDVVYSLDRAMDPKFAGFYTATFTRVQSIEATGSNQVTITLKQPDVWLQGELASTPGWIIEKAYAEQQGDKYGTPDGGIMCSGAYKQGDWKPGDKLEVVRNDNYWDSSVHPLVQEIDFKGTPDEAALTSALLTGGVNGSYAFSISTLDQLKSSSAVTVTAGPGWNSDAFIVSSFDGALGDVRVRQALSLALDRQGIIDQIYKGAAILPRALSAPGTWGYGRDVFQQAWDALPEPTQDIEKAKGLIQDAGAEGKTITIGMSNELNNLAVESGAYQAAGEAIGLKVKLKSVSAANYINFFIDPAAREGIDGFFTVNYGDFADPAALLGTLVLPDGSQNYSGYSNPQVTDLMNKARGESDPNVRAQDVAQAQALIMQDLPWIPNALPLNNLIVSSNLSGATSSFAYMFAPWANDLGGTG